MANSAQVCIAAHLLLGLVQAAVVQHPADVTVGPNDWAEFNCTVNCPCTENVTWHMVRRASTPMQSNSTTVCTSGRQTYFLSILATEALNNLGVYCVAYESREHGCNPSWRHFSRPALLVVEPANQQSAEMVTTPIRSPSLPSSCTPLQNAVCQEIPVVLIHNSTGGVQVVVSSSIVTNLAVPLADQASEQITTISGEFLPDECGPSRKRCNVVVIPYHAQVFALFPVRKGIVIVEYSRTTLDCVRYSVHRTSENCSPTTVFFTGPDSGYRLFTACLNLSGDNSHLKFLRFSFEGSNITMASFHHHSGTEIIYGPDTLSEFVYVRSQRGCMPSTDNVYVLDEGYVIRFLADETEWNFHVGIDLGCSSYQSVEYYGDNLLLVHCTNETVLTYDTCRGQVISYYHASQSGLPYPCSNWDTVAVVKEGNLTFNTSAASNITGITLPSGDVENAQCVNSGNSFLFVFTVDRTVYMFSTLDDVLQDVVPRSCNSSMCLEPIVLTTESGTLVGAYGHELSHFIIVNVTCRMNPVVLKLPSFQPDLAAMFLGRRQYPCQCESSPTLPTTMRQTLPTTMTEQPLPTSTHTFTTEATLTTESTATTAVATVAIETSATTATVTTTEATLTTETTETTGTVETEDVTTFVLKVAIPLAVGIVILIVAGILVLIMVIHLHPRHMLRNWRASKGKSNPHPMVSNPLYEGPVYETIDPQFQPLTPCTDTPNYPAIESNSAAVLNVEAVFPLNGSVTVAVSTDTIPSGVRSEDNYTVMRSAKATAVPVQPANNDNNTVRYM